MNTKNKIGAGIVATIALLPVIGPIIEYGIPALILTVVLLAILGLGFYLLVSEDG